jgi:phosphatidate phosphatase APP1
MKRLVCAVVALAAVSATAAADRLHNIIDDSWANEQGYRLTGRLTEAHAAPAQDSGKRGSLYRNTRLIFSSGEEGRVSVNVGPLQWHTRADDHGYWELQANQAITTLSTGWHDITSHPAGSGPAGLLVHDARNTLGLISDIDDTVLVSQVNDTKRLLRNSLTLSPESRQPVAGMAALYRAWAQKNPNPAATPVFYVSASPRQLSDGVRRFLQHNGFPRGAVQLKEVSSTSTDPLLDQQAYKVQRISAILKAFPGVRFVLMGDDGERDPESYAQLKTLFPDQIAGVWIRRVHPDPKRVRFDGQQDTADLLRSGPP